MLPFLRRRLSTSLVALAALLLCVSPARATTVIPPDFDALVQQADYVVRGTIKAVASEWKITQGHRHIITKVTVDVSETIAGNAPSPLVLEMLGGRVGDDEMLVQGSPVFTVGQEHVLFIRGNGVQFNPLVALMHGQYPVRRDTNGRRYMTRSDGEPLKNAQDVARPIHSHALRAATASSTEATAPVPAALSPDDFAARIRASREKSPRSR